MRPSLFPLVQRLNRLGPSASRPLSTILPPRSSLQEKDTIVRLLYNLGSKEEVEQYLSYFSSVDSQRFAVIKVGGAILENEIETLATSLAFLNKVGLFPIVIHGGGPQLNKTLEAAHIEPAYSDGIRITSPEVLAIARKVFYSANLKLVEALEKLGTRARPIVGGLYVADYLDKPKYGLVGKVVNVNLESIESCLRTGCLPIVTSLAETPDGQILNINADIAASEIAKVIKPLKIVYLSEKGGLTDGDGKLIPVINLNAEYDELMKQSWVKYGTKLKIKEINELLSHLPRTASVSVTSTTHLSRELFTHKGAGTLISKGYEILSFKNTLDGVDIPRLTGLLSQSPGFDADYLNLIKTKPYSIYVDEEYQVAAVVVFEPNHIPVLHQFHVLEKLEDFNLRENVWQKIRGDIRQMCWITDKQRPLKGWFFNHSDGSYAIGEKTVFWYGLDDISQAKSIVDNLTTSFTYPVGQKRSYSTSSKAKKISKVGMLGARGYVGQEVIKLLEAHPALDLVSLSSRELAGKNVEGYTPKESKQSLKYESLTPEDSSNKDIDCWIMALPNGLCKPYVDAILANKKNKDTVILDLSADYRFDTTWQYGLTERFREKISKAKLISNPGCYASGAQFSLLPAAEEIGFTSPPNVFGVSGYSGAGTKPSKNNDPEFLKDNLVPYTLVNHVHEREVSYQLGTPIQFMPHVAPFFQGIGLTVSMNLKKKVTPESLLSLYQSYYGKQKNPIIRVGKDIPYVKFNSGKHHVSIGGFTVSTSGDHAVVVCTLDNLLKGAATQALQNINLALGYDELEGIKLE